MILLRITVDGTTRDVRVDKPQVVLGRGAAAGVRLRGVGWSGKEAILSQVGTEVRLRRPGHDGEVRLRVGDAVHLGRARVEVAGLLPLTIADGLAHAGSPGGGGAARAPAPAPGPALRRADASLPSFGDYEEDLARAARARAAKRALAAAAAATAAVGAGTAQADGKPSEGRTSEGRPAAHVLHPSVFESPTFGEELVHQLRRAPFFVVSGALHALAFLLLALLQAGHEPGSGRGDDGALRTAVVSAAEREQLSSEEPELAPLPSPELPEPLPTPTLDEVLPPTPTTSPDPADEEMLAALPSPSDVPPEIGLNPSLASARSRFGPPRPRVNLAQPFAKGDAATANERAAEYVRAELGLGRGRQADPFADLTRTDVLVVDGSFDKIGRVLSSLRLPYTVVTPISLAHPQAPDLAQHKVVFWNCGESLPPSQMVLVARRIRQFVRDGGYLFTTDWAVANLLMPAFPGYLETSGPRAPLPESVVEIRPAEGRDAHDLLEGVFPRGAKGQWWLEQASFDLEIKRPADVTVLIESPDLPRLYGRSPALAVTFRYGQGRVLHVMGHYFQEAGNIAGTIAAHRLALNFVLMRLREE